VLDSYQSTPATIDLEVRNMKAAWGAERSAGMDISREDAIDDRLLNEVIWRSVRGSDASMPAPSPAAFVVGRDDE
jgi:hypothetical protein